VSESLGHAELVTGIVTWMRTAFAVHERSMYLLSDVREATQGNKPWPIDGFVPDVCAGTVPATFAALGEAKWFGDLETRRTANQVRAFLTFLKTQPDPHFVVGVPPQLVGTARRLISCAAATTGAHCVRLYVVTNRLAFRFDNAR